MEDDLEDIATWWASELICDTWIWGGYEGPTYSYLGKVFIVDPGNESTKYSRLYAFEPKDLIALYKKAAPEGYEPGSPRSAYNDEYADAGSELMELNLL